eukprot:s446_g25.t1
MCFAPQRRALFPHLNFQKRSETNTFDTFYFQMCFGHNAGWRTPTPIVHRFHHQFADLVACAKPQLQEVWTFRIGLMPSVGAALPKRGSHEMSQQSIFGKCFFFCACNGTAAQMLKACVIAGGSCAFEIFQVVPA